jgi:hypothetical protein
MGVDLISAGQHQTVGAVRRDHNRQPQLMLNQAVVQTHKNAIIESVIDR